MNGTTGDFSLGVQGFRLRSGQFAEPVSEMNISGNHLELWKRLSAVGNDPYLYSSMRTRPGPGRSMALADGAYCPDRRAMV